MNCAKANKLISPYLDGELSPIEQVHLADHLQDCANCRAAKAELRLQRQLLAGIKKYNAPVGFHARIMTNLDPTPAASLWWLGALTGFAEVAVLGVIIFTGIVSGSFLVERLASGKTAAVSASLGLDLFDPTPPDSLGGAYLAMTEVANER